MALILIKLVWNYHKTQKNEDEIGGIIGGIKIHSVTPASSHMIIFS